MELSNSCTPDFPFHTPCISVASCRQLHRRCATGSKKSDGLLICRRKYHRARFARRWFKYLISRSLLLDLLPAMVNYAHESPRPKTGINVLIVGAGQNPTSTSNGKDNRSDSVYKSQASAASLPPSNATARATTSKSTSPSRSSSRSATSSHSGPMAAGSFTGGRTARLRSACAR